jgi:hypothetical protein
MTDSGVPEKLLPAIRVAVFWGALPFIGILLGGERVSEGKYHEAAAWLGGAFLSILVAVYWDRLIRRMWPRYNPQPSLSYLSNKDSELGSAIVSMARRSAWGRWFAAQHLVNSGSAIGMSYLLQIAGSQVMDKILDGDLEVRGRRPGRMDYQTIPRTDWRSSAIHFVSDPISLWRMLIVPRGGVEIAPDGTIARASNPTAAARTSQLADYDSLLIDAHQFETLWPQKDGPADGPRRKLLRQARRRALDKDEIQRLSDQYSVSRRFVFSLVIGLAVVFFASAFYAGKWTAIPLLHSGTGPRPAEKPAPPTVIGSPTDIPKRPTPTTPIYDPGPDQQRALSDEIDRLASRLPRPVWITRPRDLTAQSAARNIEGAFRRAGIKVEQEEQEPAGRSEVGVMMAVSNLNSPPAIATELADAMKRVGFEMRLVPLSGPAKGKTEFAIYVGMSPL